MTPRTAATFNELSQANWFSRVGQRDATHAIHLSSWSEAINSCSSLSWENLCLDAANQYRNRLREAHPGCLAAWNQVVRSLKEHTIPLVSQKVQSVVAQFALPKSFIDAVEWDILHVCLEAEFAEIYPPGFYASQAYWYVQGHFPCGWEGDFPNGQIVIY